MHGSKCIGQEWVHAALNTFDLTLASLLGRSKLSFKLGCSDGVWGGVGFKTICSLPMGMEKNYRCMGGSVQVINRSMPP